MLGTVITKKGVKLLAKLMATKAALTFTRISVGTGKILNGYDPSEMIDLVQYKMDGAISKCNTDNDTAKITMQISSMGIESGFVISEVGVYAEDPDEGEILYSYIDLSDDPQYIYAEGGQAIKFVEITLEVVVGAETKVTAYINPESMITRDELEKELMKKVDVNGDISEMIVKTLDDITNEFPIPKNGEKSRTFMGKVRKFFEDFNAFKTGIMTLGQLVNNCVTDNPKLPLSAAQGKVLMDLYTVLNTNLVSYLKAQGAQAFGTGATGWNSARHTAYVAQNLIVPAIAGYTPIGVLQWALGSDTDENYKYVSVSKINIMANGKLEVGIVNNSDYDATNLLLYVVFLYIKAL